MDANNYQDFLEKYLKNIHSDSEHDAFIRWFQGLDEDASKEVLDQITAFCISNPAQNNPLDLLPLQNRIREEVFKDVHEPNATPLTPKPKIWLKTGWLAVAAAAAIILVTSYFAFDFTPNQETNTQVVESVETEASNPETVLSDQSILQLADGSTYYLNELQSGDIPNQSGIEVEKISKGKLVFSNKNIQEGKKQVSGINKIKTPKSEQYHIELTDGTIIWLNALSSIEFPNDFTSGDRVIKLNGEAYFEVNPYQVNGKKVPFYVLTNTQKIEVLGTHFNVNSYKDVSVVKTTLLEGSVEVTSLNRNSNKVKLKPGQQSILGNDEKEIEVLSIDAEMAISWKDGYFNFKKSDIQEVMNQLARWHDLQIIYDGDVPTEQFTGYIPKKMELQTILRILEEGGGVKFTLKGQEVIVKSLKS